MVERALPAFLEKPGKRHSTLKTNYELRGLRNSRTQENKLPATEGTTIQPPTDFSSAAWDSRTEATALESYGEKSQSQAFSLTRLVCLFLVCERPSGNRTLSSVTKLCG